MRNLMLPIGAVVFASAIGIGMFSTCGAKDTSSNSSSIVRGQLRDYPSLTTNGISLFVNNVEALSFENQEFERHGIRNLSIEEGKAKSEDSLTFEYGGKTIGHKATGIHDELWCASRRSVLFVETQKEKEVVCEWTEKKGFQTISTPFSSLENLSLSPDGTSISALVGNDGFAGMGAAEEILVLSLGDRKAKEVKFDDFCENSVPLSRDEIIIDAHTHLGHQTYRWKLNRGKIVPLFKDASIMSSIALNGSIYSLHKTSKGFEIVKLSPSLNGWSTAYKLPRGWDSESKTSPLIPFRRPRR